MEIAPIPMAVIARFYEATGPYKVTMVRDARLFQSDPDNYMMRDYYRDFRNTLRQTHWSTNDIGVFEAASDEMASRQKDSGKRQNYRETAKSYINCWRKRGASYFDVKGTQIDLFGIPVRVVMEVGMSYPGNELALKLWLNAQRPTRGFRQAIKYITGVARQDAGWHQDWQVAIWDVKREDVLPEVPMPKDFARALRGQMGAFKEIWQSLE